MADNTTTNESTDGQQNELTDLATRLTERTTTLDTTDPVTGLTDLAPVGDVLADTRVVGLGEATHGTREFFRLKHRLVRYLVEEHEFRLFGLEANFAETLALDDYVVHGEGDPLDALSGIYFWTWDTEEVLALVEWLREFNEGRDESDCVRFYGFDAQYTAGPVAALREYLKRADPKLLASVANDLTTADDDGEPAHQNDDETRATRLDAADRVVETLEDCLRDRESDHVAATDRRTWRLACQHLRTLAQARDRKRAQHEDDLEQAMTVRDRAMAENIEWILDHEEADRIVLWAHNMHVNRDENRISEGVSAPLMGHHLAERYDERYYALGFDFAYGTFQAIAETDDGRELTACSLEAPPTGSVTELFAAIDKPVVFADLEIVTMDDRLAAWFDSRRRMRSVGAIYHGENEIENHHDRCVISEAYDGLLFVRETNRAVPIARD